MMKKKLFALLMAMVLVLGMSTTVLAETNSPVVDNTPTIEKIDAAWINTDTGYTWDVMITPFEEKVAETMVYMCDVYKDYDYIETVNIEFNWQEDSSSAIILYLNDILQENGSGSYYVKIVAVDNLETRNVIGTGRTNTVEYVASDNSVVNTIDVSWVYQGDSCKWQVEIPVVEADDYILYCYKDGKEIGYTFGWSNGSTDEEFYKDLSELVENNGSGTYHVVVEARKYGTGGIEILATGTTSTAVYVDPGKKLATPEISFSEDGVVTFNMVDGAAYYELVICYYNLVNGDGGADMVYYLDASASKDGKTISVDYSKEYEDVSWEADFDATVRAYSADINVIKNGDQSESSNIWKLRMSTEKATEKLDDALKSEDPTVAKDVLTSMSNETVAEMMKEDTSKVEAADKAWAVANDIKVEAKSEVKTVDASKISIVGAALNANGVDEKDVVLNIAEPEKKVEVDKKYENAVALNIELFVAGEAKADLDVPVAITMPIPEGVSTENLVILHYHGDAEEPVVIVPTVNEDGTMTFVVGGFSTFVIANQVVEAETTPADSATSTAPKTGDTSGTVMVCSLLLLAVGVVLVMKRNAFVK